MEPFQYGCNRCVAGAWREFFAPSPRLVLLCSNFHSHMDPSIRERLGFLGRYQRDHRMSLDKCASRSVRYEARRFSVSTKRYQKTIYKVLDQEKIKVWYFV